MIHFQMHSFKHGCVFKFLMGKVLNILSVIVIEIYMEDNYGQQVATVIQCPPKVLGQFVN